MNPVRNESPSSFSGKPNFKFLTALFFSTFGYSIFGDTPLMCCITHSPCTCRSSIFLPSGIPKMLGERQASPTNLQFRFTAGPIASTPVFGATQPQQASSDPMQTDENNAVGSPQALSPPEGRFCLGSSSSSKGASAKRKQRVGRQVMGPTPHLPQPTPTNGLALPQSRSSNLDVMDSGEGVGVRGAGPSMATPEDGDIRQGMLKKIASDATAAAADRDNTNNNEGGTSTCRHRGINNNLDLSVSCLEGSTMRIPLSGKTVPFRVITRRGRGISSVVFECKRERSDMEEVPGGKDGGAPDIVTVKVMSGGESGMGTCLREVETLAFLKVKREEAGLPHGHFAELASWFYRRSAIGGVDHVCLVFRGGGVSLTEAMAGRSSLSLTPSALTASPSLLGRDMKHDQPASTSRAISWKVEEVVEIARGLLEGIAFLHSVGLVHADIKPDNVALYPLSAADATAPKRATKPAPFDLRLIDLGNAVFAADTIPGETAGTPSYLSPEATEGLAWGPPVDVWAVGCVLYEIVKGERVGSSTVSNGGGRDGGGDGGGAMPTMAVGAGCAISSRTGHFGRGFAADPRNETEEVAPMKKDFNGSVAAVTALVKRLLTHKVDERPTAEEALKDVVFLSV